MLDLLAALEVVDLTRRDDFYWAARAVLVTRRDDLARFDQAFALFWRNAQARDMPNFAPLLSQTPVPRREPPRKSDAKPGEDKPQERSIAIAEATDEETDSGDEAEETDAPDLIISASPMEVLRHKDFAGYTADELALARQILRDMTWELGERRTRRFRRGKGRRLDLRRSLRRNVRFGGEMVELAWREPKFKPRPVVVIADISGSMEQYSRLLLHFLHTLYQGMDNVEAFVFGTRLTRITHELRTRNVDVAVSQVAQTVQDWAGGTRIGESLHTFNYRWGRRVLGRGAVALIISDGWDRGNVDVLRDEMERLQRNTYRLIWLNPLLGMAGYQPLTRGMAAALPFIDDFLPVHRLHSLAELGDLLTELGAAPRPERKQHAHMSEPGS
ncbi:MAG: VWA domain-containing protein [Anaerolineae bacterium]|nr:VWA domain-containing protein [Anaerolineae bacterium]